MSRRDLTPAIVQSLGSDSAALYHLMAACMTRCDPAPAIAQAILEKAFLEVSSQAEIYRWIQGMWPTSTREEMCRAYRIASELFTVDFLSREG